MAKAAQTASSHIPVLLDRILDAAAPVSGRWVDGTFGAGGYTRALLNAGAAKVFAIDRDPEVFEGAKLWSAALLVNRGDQAVAEAYIMSRLANDWGNQFGTLSGHLALKRIAQRAIPIRA